MMDSGIEELVMGTYGGHNYCHNCFFAMWWNNSFSGCGHTEGGDLNWEGTYCSRIEEGDSRILLKEW